MACYFLYLRIRWLLIFIVKGLINRVYILRSIADARQLKKGYKPSNKGRSNWRRHFWTGSCLEMVCSGLEVSVIQFSDRIMPRQLDKSSSRCYQKLMEDKGVSLFLGLLKSAGLWSFQRNVWPGLWIVINVGTLETQILNVNYSLSRQGNIAIEYPALFCYGGIENESKRSTGIGNSIWS